MQTATFPFRLSALIQMLQDTGKTYICNAIITTLKNQGYTSPENVTSALRKSLDTAFPIEMDCTRQSGVMEFWLTVYNRDRFFRPFDDRDDNLTYEQLQKCRINFLNYLIEKYGDVELNLELEFCNW